MLPSLSPFRVAILDDHKLFRQGVARLIEQLPYVEAVDEAGTFPELLALLDTHSPAILLLDLEMPNHDGMVVAEQLQQLHPTVKIIVLSMHGADQFVHRLMQLGARSYLPKDVDQDVLREAIEMVVTTGYYVNDQIARAMVQHPRPVPRPASSWGIPAIALTPREKEILALICQGRKATEIAQALCISPRTVEGHRQNLLEKTQTPNSASLAIYAAKHQLLGASSLSFKK